jgi:ribosome modulation factor
VSKCPFASQNVDMSGWISSWIVYSLSVSRKKSEKKIFKNFFNLLKRRTYHHPVNKIRHRSNWLHGWKVVGGNSSKSQPLTTNSTNFLEGQTDAKAAVFATRIDHLDLVRQPRPRRLKRLRPFKSLQVQRALKSQRPLGILFGSRHVIRWKTRPNEGQTDAKAAVFATRTLCCFCLRPEGIGMTIFPSRIYEIINGSRLFMTDRIYPSQKHKNFNI